ncbi:hypothetical protein PH7735_02396 [Shimia thalassica]|uniref:Uncharacterized protein n=1 Tax=Shimia thalassica TaxID=1715693 RepID=A0A0P1IRV5_9RHOB|nr:hypothetical protein [Shimia thalassica]CUK00976.1 hypothetical protein PH7735_02396 [Shimia thalassica]
MNEFNRLTIVAAVEVVAASHSNDDMKVLEVQWDLEQYGVATTSKNARVSSWAKIALTHNPVVWTENGQMNLQRGLVELALLAPDHVGYDQTWHKFVAGLRFDGFVITDQKKPDPSGRPSLFEDAPRQVTVRALKRMLPEGIEGLDNREADNELEALLKKHGFATAQEHLRQAVSAFQRGDWEASNAQLRSFFESYLNEIADRLGYQGKDETTLKREFLGKLTPPFLLSDYNEWNENLQKPQFVQGLWSRMHPAGSHAGLSEQEDATFRLQITLITARLFIQRFDQRKILQ